MKYLLSCSLLLLSFLLPAQENILLRGYVYDKDNGNVPLAMAAVQIKNTQLGGLTDDNGYFEIPIPVVNLQDSMKVSYVGYASVLLSIADYQSTDTLRIYIAANAETKDEVVVVAMNARGVLLKAIENMRTNFSYDSLIAKGFYRQYHKENGKYVRLIESDIQVAFNCRNIYRYSFHEMVAIHKERRSVNYETNGDTHGDHLVDLLKENPFSYNKNNFLDPKQLDFYAPKFLSEDSAQYVIRLQYKESSSKKLVQAKVWVEKETFALTRMEIEKFPNPNYKLTRYEVESRWKLVNEKDVIETTKINGKYVVSNLVRDYNHHVLNRETGNVDFVVEESFELHFYNFNFKQVGQALAKNDFESMTDLYTKSYQYDASFWDHYKPLREFPIPAKVAADLDSREPLLEQFKHPGQK